MDIILIFLALAKTKVNAFLIEVRGLLELSLLLILIHLKRPFRMVAIEKARKEFDIMLANWGLLAGVPEFNTFMHFNYQLILWSRNLLFFRVTDPWTCLLLLCVLPKNKKILVVIEKQFLLIEKNDLLKNTIGEVKVLDKVENCVFEIRT